MIFSGFDQVGSESVSLERIRKTAIKITKLSCIGSRAGGKGGRPAQHQEVGRVQTSHYSLESSLVTLLV